MRFSAAPDLEGLKDFQRRTVDYTFQQLYGNTGITRFLVADEVGLGKTLIAKGLIARVLEHLQDTIERIDIVYVCSNSAIAAQNVNRLKVTGQNSFAVASRLTLLPLHVRELKNNRVNFISFTPGTTFDLRSKGGVAQERMLIFKMLEKESWNVSMGLLNILQLNVTVENWRQYLECWDETVDNELADKFRRKIQDDNVLSTRLNECCTNFRRYRKHIPDEERRERLELVGILRYELAKCCLNALEPDLVILDEFQRFKDLLDGDGDAALLARALFEYRNVRTLLLSATPYKMLSLDNEDDDDHYPDFLRTLRFLCNDDEITDAVQQDIRDYRKQIFSHLRRNSTAMSTARDRVQQKLMKVMCRTERVGITKRLDAMLSEPEWIAPLDAGDLEQAALADNVAREVKAGDTVEYWKSSPYLLNFLKHYELRKKIDAVGETPSENLCALINAGKEHILEKSTFEKYAKIDPANARMRLIVTETLDNGMWQFLWMPPSLPYMEPAGEYAAVGSVTKSLVFSSWNVVPDAVATVCSYEAERRMMESGRTEIQRGELYDKVKPLLRFAKGRDDRLTGMPALIWMLPSPVLANVIDPLALAIEEGGELLPRETLLCIAEERCATLLQGLHEGEPGPRSDERWYWAAVAMLESKTAFQSWCASGNSWKPDKREEDTDTRFQDHLNQFVAAAEGLDLGPRPDDLAQVLAELSLGAPGICALRALRRATTNIDADDPTILSAAMRVSNGLRTLFNLPESIILLRGRGEDVYWRLALQYAINGNLQSVLDEQVHVLTEQLGLLGHDDATKVNKIAESIADSLSIRTTQIQVDEMKVEGGKIKTDGFNARCRFALRFGELRDDKDTTVARADTVREAFNSPFRPFVLASTSIGQEGLDFHTWCHSVVHWNLPSNPVDFEQREGRVHRYKGHAIRKNIAEHYGLSGLKDWNKQGDPWFHLFDKACRDRTPGTTDLIPFWVYEEGAARIERRVPMIRFSKEEKKLERLKRDLALYRLVFGQPRQEDLLAYLNEHVSPTEAESISNEWRISLAPPQKN